MKDKCNVSIFRSTYNKGKDTISIEIEDKLSHIGIVKVSMTLEEFGKAVTGLGHCEGDVERVVSEENINNIGKVKLIKDVECDTLGLYQKDSIKNIVYDHYKDSEDYNYDEWKMWKMWPDGLSTRQDKKLHVYTIYKYVTLERALELEEKSKTEDLGFRICLPIGEL